MRRLYYRLAVDGVTPISCDDARTWGRWLETAERRVARDMDEGEGAAKICVSTVFTGLDHNYDAVGPPVLWETMVFGGLLDGEQERYTSHAAALAGHERMCARVRETLR